MKQTLCALLAALGFVVQARASTLIGWEAPTQNTDSTPLTNLAGFRIFYGSSTAITNLTKVEVPNPGLRSYSVDLPAGTWYIRMTAYTATGAESVVTSPASVTVAGPPPSSQLLTSGSLAYELRSASSTMSMVAIGLIPAGQPCGPEVQTVTNLKYCRIQRSQIDAISWPTDLKLQSVWARTP